MKGLSDKNNFSERICLIARSDDITGVLHAAQRAAELKKKGFELIETYAEEGQQNMIFEVPTK